MLLQASIMVAMALHGNWPVMAQSMLEMEKSLVLISHAIAMSSAKWNEHGKRHQKSICRLDISRASSDFIFTKESRSRRRDRDKNSSLSLCGK